MSFTEYRYERIRIEDHNFPHDLLEACETALVVFCAAFLGRQDAFWVAEAGLTATCVDTDAERLEQMKEMYPEDWTFVCRDAFHYADYAGRLTKHSGPAWDVVTLDPFTQDMDKVAAGIGDWCRLARRCVILGTGKATQVIAPADWVVSDRRLRTMHDGGVYWTVLEPA